MSGYIGTQPVPQATQTRDAFTATANQLSFPTGGYTPGFLDVFLNGVKLAAADYTATNGSDVILATGAALNDILEVVAYTTFQISSNATAAQGAKADSALQSIADGSITQPKLAAEAVSEAKLQVSNAPTNGYALTAQSGNTGGMTWAETGTADDSVNEAKLQVSNAPVDGYALTAQSGNTGGLTWAETGTADDSVNEAKLQVSNAPTNGYMLTAQSGNAGGLTWAAAPTSSTTLGAVGTYLLASNGTGTISAGSTYSGSGLRPSGFSTNNASTAVAGYSVIQGGTIGSTQAGTWRAMGAFSFSVYTYKCTLFVRIS
tara:strand:+ start:1407 stop:2357 length:951 start_codon:yes stop_codon:yes gene_type:complete